MCPHVDVDILNNGGDCHSTLLVGRLVHKSTALVGVMCLLVIEEGYLTL